MMRTSLFFTGSLLLFAASFAAQASSCSPPTSGSAQQEVSNEPRLWFGGTRAGERSVRSWQVKNRGTTVLEIQNVRIQGADADQFRVKNAPRQKPGGILGLLPGVRLQPGEGYVIKVRYTPTRLGPVEAELVIEASAPMPWTSPRVMLEGVGLGQAGSEVLANAGGSELVDSDGEPWAADYGFLEGTVRQFTAPVAQTTNDALYQTQRLGSTVRASFALPEPGSYLVRLHFTEFQNTADGQRIFDVYADGDLVVPALDVHARNGWRRAHVETFVGSSTDSMLDLELVGLVGQAMLSAVEIRGERLLVATPAEIDFGAVSNGQTESRSLLVENPGIQDLTIESVGFRFGSSGTSAAFSIDLGGSTFLGAAGDVTYGASIPLDAGDSLLADVCFSPTGEQYDSVVLELGHGDGILAVDLTGLGGHEGDPFLHVVIDHPEFVVDYDADGSETVLFDGSGSHTHEPGRAIVDYRWYSGGSLIASGQPLLPLDLGIAAHDVTLEIVDDGLPVRTLSQSTAIAVRAANEVPGLLASYYPTTPGGATALLDNVPASAEFAEVLTNYRVDSGSTVGGSSYTTNVLVVLVGEINLPVPATLDFMAVGGVDHRLSLNGTPVAGPRALSSGAHQLEARFAVNDLGDLPLLVWYSNNGKSPKEIPASLLTHDETGLVPVINGLPSSGTTLGGNAIIISGLGFFPDDQVTVHWGAQDLTLADFDEIGPDEIRFASPAGNPGTIGVTVETPRGVSNARTFQYDDAGPVPIEFTNPFTYSGVPQPTSGAWGPDGRLYVTALDGRVTALTFGDDMSLQGQTTYPGINALQNHDTLGIAINPYDPPNPVRIYVAHGEHFLNGGSSFTGPSDYTGQITMLEGPSFDNPVPLITGLPTSNHDHGVNGIVFDNNGDLLIAMGGNTNAGVTHPNAGDIPESPLSGAILIAETSKPGFNGAITYVETVGGAPNSDQVDGDIVDVAAGVDVDVYAPGLRNPYGLILASNGRFYATDNGPNIGFGAASTGATTETADPYDPDEVILVEYGNYYGHPNRTRGRYDPRQNIYYRGSTGVSLGEAFTQAIYSLSSSTNGLDEYRADTFGGQMRGDILVQKWGSYPRRVEMSDDGQSVVSFTAVYPWTGGLSLITGPGGTLIAFDYSNSRVPVLVPNDAGANGLVVYDITPWRAPATGGTEFVIGGEGFGTLGDTSVTIGGRPAVLTYVSATRIRGIVPAEGNPTTQLLDVVVNVAGQSDTHARAFRYLLGPGLEPGRWETLDNVPTALGEVAAAVVGGELFLFGEGSTATYAYDLLGRQWIGNKAPRPYPGHHHAVEVVADKVYLIGGLGGGSEGKVQIFDPATNSWSVGADMTWAGGSICTAAIDGRIYAAGGIVSTWTVGNAAVYDPELDSWTPRPQMPAGRNHAATGAFDGKMYVFGGRTNGNWVTNGFDDVQVYDPQSNTWESSTDAGSTLAPLPQARGGTGKAVLYRGEFYVFGGETANGAGALPGQNVYDRVDVYNPRFNTWRAETIMPEGRHGVYPVRFGAYIYLAGGGRNAGFSQSFVFDRFTRP